MSAEGMAFFRETERLLANADELHDAARDIRDGRLSRLRIVAMPAMAHGLLPEALAGAGEGTAEHHPLGTRARRQRFPVRARPPSRLFALRLDQVRRMRRRIFEDGR